MKNKKKRNYPTTSASISAISVICGLFLLAGCEQQTGAAKESANTPVHTVIFDADGGMPEMQTKKVSPGASLGDDMVGEPANSDYIFGGWYTKKNGDGTLFTASTPVTGNMRLFAKWAEGYTVTFDADGGTPLGQSKIVDKGDTVGAANMPGEPFKQHYDFDGWYTEQNGGGEEFTALTPVNENILVYAKWTIIKYTVTFDADGGTPSPQPKTINSGSSIGSANMPANPAKGVLFFDGWYTEKNGGGEEFTALTPVTGDVTVYAGYVEGTAQSLSYMLDWINANAEEGSEHTFTLTKDETFGPKTLSCGGKNVSITIKGDALERTVTLNENGSLLTIGAGITLTLDKNITLAGRNNNNDSLVKVNQNGKLVMNTGSKITGNTCNSGIWGGGGVLVYYGLFDMNGGTISGNKAGSGGGVYMTGASWAPSVFNMSGGAISGNSITGIYGGGVYISSDHCTFNMRDGIINENETTGSGSKTGGGVAIGIGGVFVMEGGTISDNKINTSGNGGGVSVVGTFTMKNGTISGNIVKDGRGGGVSVTGTFTMEGGTISDNKSVASNGGGVNVPSGVFTMKNGSISGNSAKNGGGVNVENNNSKFTMEGGTISGNTVTMQGGGVYVLNSGKFAKQSGGIIYGSNENNATLKNTAGGNPAGYAVYVSSPAKKRDFTVEVSVTLNTDTPDNWD